MTDLTRLLRFLVQLSRTIPRSRLSFSVVVAAGAFSGLSNTVLLAMINVALTRRQLVDRTFVGLFALLCLLLPSARLLSRAVLVRLTNRGISALRLQLCRQILGTPLPGLETLGAHRLLVMLTEDVGAISTALMELPLLSMHLAILVGCLVYLGWLSWAALVVLVVCIAIGALAYSLAMHRGLRYFESSRRERDSLFRHFRALTLGIKELQLHGPRSRTFLAKARATSDQVQEQSFKGDMISATADSWGHVLFFFVVGVLILGLPRFGQVDPKTLTGYTLVVLYLMTPLEFLLNSLPIFSRARVAIAKVEQLEGTLAEPVREGDLPPSTSFALRQGLRTHGLMYSYRQAGRSEDFTVGPLDLAFKPGEIVFLTGGNGSGKTTLAKLLVGLYGPAGGEIVLDGETVTEATRDDYRQWFSAVFQDFFVFDDLLGLERPGLDALAQEQLVRLRLEHEVTIENGRFSRVDLSQGQRKRLALLTVFLEDRPIYVFDEWAADQDPLFKGIFYTEILGSLKRRGKTVFVISHDDRYYGCADRIIKFDNGQVVADSAGGDPLAAGVAALQLPRPANALEA